MQPLALAASADAAVPAAGDTQRASANEVQHSKGETAAAATCQRQEGGSRQLFHPA